jgi:hypothetical protein
VVAVQRPTSALQHSDHLRLMGGLQRIHGPVLLQLLEESGDSRVHELAFGFNWRRRPAILALKGAKNNSTAELSFGRRSGVRG